MSVPSSFARHPGHDYKLAAEPVAYRSDTAYPLLVRLYGTKVIAVQDRAETLVATNRTPGPSRSIRAT